MEEKVISIDEKELNELKKKAAQRRTTSEIVILVVCCLVIVTLSWIMLLTDNNATFIIAFHGMIALIVAGIAISLLATGLLVVSLIAKKDTFMFIMIAIALMVLGGFISTITRDVLLDFLAFVNPL